MAKLLILGGTAEARALADRLAGESSLDVITSLAGRTRSPRLPAGTVRTGGFGGADGLADFLREARIDLLIDATHPYAARISHNAAEAGNRADIPRLMLLRPEWAREAGDHWIDVGDAAEAAERLNEIPGPVFLAIGRQDLAPFAELGGRSFVVRMVEAIEAPLPIAGATIFAGRGPFKREEELTLIREHKIRVVVSKNSGGTSAYAKIVAARELSIPVIMLRRPGLPDGPTVASVDDAVAWVDRQIQ